MKEVIKHPEMITAGIAAYDVQGHRIHRVRSVQQVDGGINVTVLHNTYHKNYPVLGYSDEEGSCEGIGVIEFSAFVPGGYIGERQCQSEA